MSAARHRSKAADDEDAAQLKFGPEFSGEIQKGCIVISEVKLLLEQAGKKSDNAVFKKTLDYVSTFARFHEPETVASVRAVFEGSGLADFEMVQIANLCPASAEEAKALIPSLGERDDDTLQQYLNQIASLRKYQ
ncbi:HRDC-like protein [Leucosporidium creatinivorum]|uniref:HRDC-like protein n=1 Tax=Leucosporidium creatinivorum TaxID=106004 RepID=A0A1Y2EC82_9BASI|nr:HRDC-like protein [Leucosporidium creatinivorum]